MILFKKGRISQEKKIYSFHLSVKKKLELALNILKKKGKKMGKRNSGKPYTSHAEEVAVLCFRAGLSIDHLILGVLHDMVEDGVLTIRESEKLFGKQITIALNAISRKRKEPYLRYIWRCAQNPLARKVKWHDIISNMDGFSSLKKRLFLYPLGLLFLQCVSWKNFKNEKDDTFQNKSI